MISEGFIDCASRDAGEYGVGALVVGEGDQPDGMSSEKGARAESSQILPLLNWIFTFSP